MKASGAEMHTCDNNSRTIATTANLLHTPLLSDEMTGNFDRLEKKTNSQNQGYIHPIYPHRASPSVPKAARRR